MGTYYLLDVRAWINFKYKRPIGEGHKNLYGDPTVYCIEDSLKKAEKELKSWFNDALIVDENWDYVHSNCYKQFKDFRESILNSHFIGRN